eukprot:24643_1
MNVSFLTGSEGSLASLVADFHSQRVPFMVNIYTFDINFERIDSQSGEVQQFEKLVYPYPRNPDQSAYDPCFISKQGQYHVSPIIDEFFQAYSMGTSQINLLLSKYLLRSSEKWLNAACDCMKDNSSWS